MMIKAKYLLCCMMLCCPDMSWAEDGFTDNSSISVYAKACETIRFGESKSGSRERATDKASFKAIESITELSDLRSQLSQHDFNVLVYNLVDNYLEDMAVRTLEKDDEHICVEVTGYLSPQNIELAENSLQNSKQEKVIEETIQNDNFLELEIEEEQLPEIVTTMPPKPEPKIHEDIAYKYGEGIENTSQQNNFTFHDIKIFIEKTKFYNGSSTNGFFNDISQVLSENPNIKTIQSKTDADYILESNVLRAKVDPINKQTYRLQLVVQLELIDTAKGNKITEHQNRFILFESSDNEQTVALSLMKKLLAKGCKQLLPKIKSPSSASNQSSAVITPQASQKQ